MIFHQYKDNTYSQFGEDGIIAETLKRIGLHVGLCVEFGGHNGIFCSNTALLRDNGWVSYMYDMEPQGPLVHKLTITPENVNNLPKCEVLSIDCDGPDYHIWKAYNGWPDIVIIEVDSSMLPPREVVAAGHHATSYYSMVKLGIEKGYFLVAHTGNCIFVTNEYRHLFPECKLDPLEYWEQYFDKSHL